ncbi:MAG TPA: transporter, partial [Stenotrophomonas sp.]|nr:transporter [Stenotrophomonas sp.]
MMNPTFPMTRLRPLVLACLTTLALSACVSSGHYQADAPRVPAGYGRGDAARNLPTETVDSLPHATQSDVREDHWWQQFGDRRLDRVIERALAANTDLASAGLAVQRARLQA